MDNLMQADVKNDPPDFSRLDRYPKGVEPVFEVVSMAQLGFTLPVGSLIADGTRNRALSFRDLGLARQLEIADYRESTKQLKITDLVNETLRQGATLFGGVNLTALDAKETMAFLMQFYAGDVFQAYAAMRYFVLGPTLIQPVTCPVKACGFEWAAHFDLGEMDVYVPVNPPKRLEWFVALRDGLRIERQGAVVRLGGLWVRASTWGHQMTLRGEKESERRAEGLRFQIVGAETAEGEPYEPHGFLLEDRELRALPEDGGLSTYDAAELEASIDDNAPGPQLGLAVTCPTKIGGCGTDFKVAVDVRHDVFFKRSRPSRRRGSN